MEQELVDFQKLLDDFSKIHIPKEEKTFMGICQYPGSRFEEICSRILAFYFNPKEDHGFRDLWFRALYQCVENSEGYNISQDIKIRLEEYTYYAEESNKRIDIIIETDDTVYAIENKIGALLYNNLAIYAQHIDNCDDYKCKKKVKIVLTAHILGPDEKQKAKDNGFMGVSYKTLFENVNAISGDYIASNNLNQVAFMFDFMKTLNNKMNFMENKERAEFFYRNKESVEKMIEQYQKWREEVLNRQSEEIAVLCQQINDEIDKEKIEKKAKWGTYQGWDLFVIFNEGTDKKIGIESSFNEVGDNPFAVFKIYITTWGNHTQSIKSWNLYKNAIEKSSYSRCYLDKGETAGGNGRVYLHVAEIDGDKTDEIISKLKECYIFLQKLANKVAQE